MKYINTLNNLFILFIVSVFCACANMVNPSGGARDIDAPVLLRSKPEINSKNFKEKSIELTFNEYINLKDIQNQFIISPSNIEAEIKKDGKKIKINFNTLPKDSTTYILNFGDAISDYSENNTSKDFKFVFTTGNYIDSLSISGSIIDAFKIEPIKDVIVCLYIDVNDDSIVYKKKPDYTVRTNELGAFKFSNLKNNTYKIFAIKEENNNKIFDSEEEQIAYIDTNIILNHNIQLSNLRLFKEIPKKRKLINKDISYQKVELVYNKKNNIEIININAKIDTVIYSQNKDTIGIYYLENADSTSLYISEENNIDTINVKFPKGSKKRELNIVVDNKIIDDKISIITNDLFRINNLDSIQLFEDSVSVKYKIEKTYFNKYHLKYNFNADKKYYVKILDSAFVSFQKSYSKKLNTNLIFINNEDYGTLNIKPLDNPNIIYELLNDKNEVIRKSINAQKDIQYINISPGVYRLRMTYDTNRNNMWDTGNYIKNIQPEQIEYYLNPIKIRANWDLEIIIIP